LKGALLDDARSCPSAIAIASAQCPALRLNLPPHSAAQRLCSSNHFRQYPL